MFKGEEYDEYDSFRDCCRILGWTRDGIYRQCGLRRIFFFGCGRIIDH